MARYCIGSKKTDPLGNPSRVDSQIDISQSYFLRIPRRVQNLSETKSRGAMPYVCTAPSARTPILKNHKQPAVLAGNIGTSRNTVRAVTRDSHTQRLVRGLHLLYSTSRPSPRLYVLVISVGDGCHRWLIAPHINTRSASDIGTGASRFSSLQNRQSSQSSIRPVSPALCNFCVIL